MYVCVEITIVFKLNKSLIVNQFFVYCTPMKATACGRNVSIDNSNYWMLTIRFERIIAKMFNSPESHFVNTYVVFSCVAPICMYFM